MKRLISMILALTLVLALASCGEDTEPVPNEHFGMAGGVYSPDTSLPIGECEGDTDLLTVDAVYLTQPNSAYDNYSYWGAYWGHTEDDALTLNLAVTIAEGFTAGLTSRRFDNWMTVEARSEHDEGYVEKLADGEWTVVAGLNLPKGKTGKTNVSTGTEPFVYLTEGTSILSIPFPIHEPGEYRITYRFRECTSDNPDRFIYSTGTEQYSVTHTLTIPEPSGKKFDLLSLSFAEGRWGSTYYEFAALLRTNDGTIPYQDLYATRLEVSAPGGWVDAAPAENSSYTTAVVHHVDKEQGQFAGSAYTTTHPFTGEAVENVFCGTAKFAVVDRTLAHRLTLEFTENADGSGERYVLQLLLDFSEVQQ